MSVSTRRLRVFGGLRDAAIFVPPCAVSVYYARGTSPPRTKKEPEKGSMKTTVLKTRCYVVEF